MLRLYSTVTSSFDALVMEWEKGGAKLDRSRGEDGWRSSKGSFSALPLGFLLAFSAGRLRAYVLLFFLT